MSAIVIVGAMVAVSFGSHATSQFVGDSAAPAWDNVVLGFSAVDTLRKEPTTFVAILALAALAVVLELTWKGAGGSAAAAEPEKPLTRTG